MSDSRTYEFEGTTPEIDEGAHISHESTLVGDVTVAADANVWPGVVLRGDVGPVRIGEGTHVGDNAVLHASTADRGAMIGHGSILNDATVEAGALVGFNATINTDVVVGEGSIVGSGTVVPEGYEIPPESWVRGLPARVTPLSETEIDAEELFESYSSGKYSDLAARHTELFE